VGLEKKKRRIEIGNNVNREKRKKEIKERRKNKCRR
jgi:hypothetical protein